MERTVPSATSEEIQLYRSTIYSLLRSSAEVKIRTIEEVHAGMKSLMHPGARLPAPDLGAFIYSALRLPDQIARVRTVILGQNADVFRRSGFSLEGWSQISARARRRRCFYDGQTTLACFIASRSDIEDVIPVLTAYQIEWNKMHRSLLSLKGAEDIRTLFADSAGQTRLAAILRMSIEDLGRLQAIWGGGLADLLVEMRERECSFGIRLLSGSFSQYLRATHEWFEGVLAAFPQLMERPVYFVSSNTHSIANLLTGYALRREADLVKFIESELEGDIKEEWRKIENGQVKANRDNFFYYLLKKFQNSPAGRGSSEEQAKAEREAGIVRVISERTFDVEAQVTELRKLDPAQVDSRLCPYLPADLAKSDAVILNIDYPLGLAAYNLLSTISTHIPDLRGVYSMGKSASLNAARGDVILPNTVQDEHSHNTYLFQNCFNAADVAPFLNYGTILDNQKAICVLGTFLQNAHLMDVFYREGFADIEMELGNFCSAVFEASRPKRYPLNEIVNLYNIDLDFGALHYVSDTPMNTGKTLGEGPLSYFGVDSTYACSLAILKRIFDLESKA